MEEGWSQKPAAAAPPTVQEQTSSICDKLSRLSSVHRALYEHVAAGLPLTCEPVTFHAD